MTDVNVLNAIAQEQARIREEVVKLPKLETMEEGKNEVTAFIRLSDVLSILKI